MASKLKITPLGGVCEIGKNMTVIEYGKDIVVIDCGSTFPGDEMYGVDLVIPDMTYLEKNAERIRGFLITHGHEDHIGAVPYALKKLPDVPIYGTKLTLALIESKFEEHEIKAAKLNVVKSGDIVKLGCMSVEFIRVCHSIAGSLALAVTTPMGVVIHSGDFKVDYTPIDGEAMDLGRLAQYGQKGVLALLCESTNVEVPGNTMSEKMVGETFERYFKDAKGRVIVATFASNVHRVQQICDTAIRHGRKICYQGRSMIKVSQLATELGYLNVPDEHVIALEKLKNYRQDEICVITTGSQGEPMSGLTRMANGAHRLNIGKDDMVIISASAIPGNERTISQVINKLFKLGANVVYEAMADVHVSGHARREELKMMHALTKPRYFLPVHGEYRHLMQHAMLAQNLGMDEANIFVMEIGQGVEFDRVKGAKPAAVVPSGSIMIDGSGVGDIGNVVLKDRKLLSQEGLFVVVVTVDRKSGRLLAGPEILSRGFVYMRENEELIEEARELVKDVVLGLSKKPYRDWGNVKNSIRQALVDLLYKKTKRNPLVLPVIMEVGKP